MATSLNALFTNKNKNYGQCFSGSPQARYRVRPAKPGKFSQKTACKYLQSREQKTCRRRERNRLAETVRTSRETDSRNAAFIAANTAESKKANGTLILDVRTVTILADYFVITGAQSTTQVRAIADAIEESLSQLGIKAKSIEGKREGRWVLLDFDIVIVHILQETERNFYKLEQFWNHALIVPPNEWLNEESFKTLETSGDSPKKQ